MSGCEFTLATSAAVTPFYIHISCMYVQHIITTIHVTDVGEMGWSVGQYDDYYDIISSTRVNYLISDIHICPMNYQQLDYCNMALFSSKKEGRPACGLYKNNCDQMISTSYRVYPSSHVNISLSFQQCFYYINQALFASHHESSETILHGQKIDVIAS